MELMIIIGLMLLVMIPVIVYAMSVRGEQEESRTYSEAQLSVNRLGHTIDVVGNMGLSSSVKTEIILPQNLVFFTFNSTGDRGEVFARVFTGMGYQDLVYITEYPIDNQIGSISTPGRYLIEVSSINNTVRVRIVGYE